MIIKEYAKIKLEELKRECDRYKNEEKEIKQKLNEIESRLEELKKQQEGLVVKQKFSFIEKLITKRKDYKIMKLIKELQQEYDEEEKIVDQKWKATGKQKRLFEIADEIEAINQLINDNKTEPSGITILEAIKFLESIGIQPVLTEEDKVIFPHLRNYSSKSSLIGVHKTRYAPFGNMIRTAQASNVQPKENIIINGVKYEYSWTSARDTIHMAMNDEVLSHDSGKWNDCKYAILIPFDDIPNEKIGRAEPMDTFTKGNIELTENSWILCPKSEVKRIKTFNPRVHVLGYEGENVMGFSQPFLTQLGYRAEDVGKWDWHDSESFHQFCELMEREGIKRGAHSFTYFHEDEEFLTSINKAVSLSKLLRDNHLITSPDDIENIMEQLADNNQSFGSILCDLVQRSDVAKNDIAPQAIRGNGKQIEVFLKEMEKNGFEISPVYQDILKRLNEILMSNCNQNNKDKIFDISEEEQKTVNDLQSILVSELSGGYDSAGEKIKAFNRFISTVICKSILKSQEKEKEKEEEKGKGKGKTNKGQEEER